MSLHIQEMLQTHPRGGRAENRDALAECIEACFSCAQTCTACADACLGEDNVKELIQCIRNNLDCADLCFATGRLLTRRTAPDNDLVIAQLQACARACNVCGHECERHSMMMAHCKVCAEACHMCEAVCMKLAA